MSTKSKKALTQPVRVLIVDFYSAANQGDAAILTGLLASLRQEIRESTFTVHTWYPALLSSRAGLAARRPLITCLADSRRNMLKTAVGCVGLLVCSLLVRLRLDITSFLPLPVRESYEDYRQANLIVGMGGGFYNDNYWVALPGRLCHLLIGKILGKPVAISAHSFGPFHRLTARLMVRAVFNRLDAIGVRDEASWRLLHALGIAPRLIHKVADSAWLLDDVPSPVARHLLEQTSGPIAQPPLISVSARHWPYYQGLESSQGHANYVRALVQALDNIIAEHGATVFFLSTCAEDRQVGVEVKRQIFTPDKFVILTGDWGPAELKGIYGLMDLHLGTRMHSVILAMSAKTPCVGISYEPKLLSLMHQLGLPEYVISIEEVTGEVLTAMANQALRQRVSYMKRLDRELPILKQLAKKNAAILAGLLDQ